MNNPWPEKLLAIELGPEQAHQLQLLIGRLRPCSTLGRLGAQLLLESFNIIVTLLAPIIDGRIAKLLKARTTLPTASVNGEIERVVNGGAPLSAVTVGGGA